jgi:hypothetical protein
LYRIRVITADNEVKGESGQFRLMRGASAR